MSRELFFQIPVGVVELGLLRKMTLSDLAVYLCLASHVGWRSGKCWPGWKLIARETNLGKNAIFRALDNLKKYGLIHIVKRGRKNEYILTKSLQSLPDNVPSGREQLRKCTKRDEKGRIVTFQREYIIPHQREHTIPFQRDLHSNEKNERKEIITSKTVTHNLTISKKTLRELKASRGEKWLKEYMVAHGHDLVALQELIEEEGEAHG